MAATNTISLTHTPAGKWQLRSTAIVFDRGPAIMGIVNVTPDSFSDGGKYLAHQAAIDHALRLEDAGANILDIGGESTRPYSRPVELQAEIDRVIPVVAALSGRVAVPISIDTSKASVAKAAIDCGAQIVNDVTGLEGDADMIAVVASHQVGVCAMHSQGTPQTMQDNPAYSDVVKEIFDYLRQRSIHLQACGITADRICVDPGIGFGKTSLHNWQLLKSADAFLALGHPVLVGHSRKGFIGKMSRDSQTNRDAGTLGISLAMAQRGIQVLRVHDVASTVEGLACFQACFDQPALTGSLVL